MNQLEKRIGILGCGWLGKPLAVALLNDGYAVKGSTTTPEKVDQLEQLGIDTYLVDIANPSIPEDFLNVSVLIICITSKSVSDFERLVSQIENSPIQKVIFISSTSVYPNLNIEITEEDQLAEGNALVQIEEVLQGSKAYHSIVLRFAGLLGYNRHPSNWFQNRRIPNPDGFVNMIHRDDCIAILKQLIQQNIGNEVFNACSNHHPTRRDFYTNARLRKGLPAPEFVNVSEESWKIISSNKLQKAFGYSFKYDDLFAI
ncbi:MAG: dTDP-glucose 4,6-dehydratase [Flavobacteriaceae bacterium]|nr:dTDP-glucose 4,6-dehydratase [Flavobacteriaceae bacterium]|tara:strand:+ start:32026 stop:32799 length:774 start_codon:yes stop_codon:yes gene_type:complete